MRANARQADATALDFDDNSFDAVLSWIMLHHTVAWEKALAEAVRVVRPGGHVVGYDLLSTAPLRLIHQTEGAEFRMMRMAELQTAIASLAVASGHDAEPRRALGSLQAPKGELTSSVR